MMYVSVKNHQRIPFSDIPVTEYGAFRELILHELMANPDDHCVQYFGVPMDGGIRLIVCVARDSNSDIRISSCQASSENTYPSCAASKPALEKFEREITELYNIQFEGHPWNKPVRYPWNRAMQEQRMEQYPFYTIDSEELHEVGVGPVHAGIIEPGHFRFICNGEQILHMETQLGYQHRGIESLFLKPGSVLQKATLAENIAGDTAVGHTTCFAHLWESLCGFEPSAQLKYSRTLALELERIAIHTGGLSAMCADIGYQLGNSVFGRLRTPVINFFQQWCGNRVAKSLIRPFGTHFPFTPELGQTLSAMFDRYEPDFLEMCHELFKLPSALSRFEKTGVVSLEQAAEIGAVGVAARMSGLCRDIRASHPDDLYPELQHTPIVKHHGDVYSRTKVRKQEIEQSLAHIRQLLTRIPAPEDGLSASAPEVQAPGPYPHSGHAFLHHPPAPAPGMFVLSLVEGWRGEICHCAITDPQGALMCYKVKDPSFHNWLALALAVRNNEISDFPICNKSFDLSYCGHDL
jgi:Ni,Fe-hydrogenase III large subunit